MDLRACYATYIIRKHVKSVVRNDGSAHRSFKHFNEEQFLEMLSSVMIICVDQLRAVYMAATYTSNAGQVAHLLQTCTSVSNDGNDE